MTLCGSGVDAAAPAGGRPVLPPFDVEQESVPLLHGSAALLPASSLLQLELQRSSVALLPRMPRSLCTQRPFVARARRETTHRTPGALPRAVRRHDVRASDAPHFFAAAPRRSSALRRTRRKASGTPSTGTDLESGVVGARCRQHRQRSLR
ncbi:hypothetical protein FA09DRAFT_329663 [Tilletiopsis washingtonensis]|uniref:Uncharacterized protein n=1 Tax=Tilletiopsis washingtonensis TaxID=58919 RepID=A0A316ZC66_9BASI|nr:hypothetical protein FA09DRAFT_329663 [Tilletiopsis washingtonensis]PWN98614.1 hypothetical protein FA09DRAFT_329663 [Tilletiopsis washingtonensis]